MTRGLSPASCSPSAARTKGAPVSAQTIIELRDAAWSVRLAAKDEQIARLRDLATTLINAYEVVAEDYESIDEEEVEEARYLIREARAALAKIDANGRWK